MSEPTQLEAPPAAGLLDTKLAYTMAEAAILLGCPETLLRDAVTERRIRHRRLGSARGVRFTREDLEDFLEQCVVDTQTRIGDVMSIQPKSKRRAA